MQWFSVNALNLQGATDEQLKQNAPKQRAHTHAQGSRWSRWSRTHVTPPPRLFLLWLEAKHQVWVPGFIRRIVVELKCLSSFSTADAVGGVARLQTEHLCCRLSHEHRDHQSVPLPMKKKMFSGVFVLK